MKIFILLSILIIAILLIGKNFISSAKRNLFKDQAAWSGKDIKIKYIKKPKEEADLPHPPTQTLSLPTHPQPWPPHSLPQPSRGLRRWPDWRRVRWGAGQSQSFARSCRSTTWRQRATRRPSSIVSCQRSLLPKNFPSLRPNGGEQRASSQATPPKKFDNESLEFEDHKARSNYEEVPTGSACTRERCSTRRMAWHTSMA